MAFADCNTPPVAPLTAQEICEGFARCGADGLRVNAVNLNRVISWVETQNLIDIDALVTNLCGNAAFQACVAAIATPSTHTVLSSFATPTFGVEGTTFCFTVNLNSNALISPVQIPVFLTGDEQLVNNYPLPIYLTIPVGQSSGTLCVATIDDPLDEPNRVLTLNLGTTPRLPGFTGSAISVTIADNDAAALIAPIAPSGAPFTDTGPEGTAL